MFKRTMLSILVAIPLMGAESLLAQEGQDSPKSGPKQKQVLENRQRPRVQAQQPRRQRPGREALTGPVGGMRSRPGREPGLGPMEAGSREPQPVRVRQRRSPQQMFGRWGRGFQGRGMSGGWGRGFQGRGICRWGQGFQGRGMGGWGRGFQGRGICRWGRGFQGRGMSGGWGRGIQGSGIGRPGPGMPPPPRIGRQGRGGNPEDMDWRDRGGRRRDLPEAPDSRPPGRRIN